MRTAPWARPTSRLPIRLRLLVGFAGATAIVLALVGVFLAGRFSAELDQSIDIAQKAQAEDVVALVAGAGGPAAVEASGERYAQVYSVRGEVLGTTRAAIGRRLLTAAEAARASRGVVGVRRRAVGAADVRVRAIPARLRSGRPVAVAVGDSLDGRDQSQDSLAKLLLIALPAALLVASLVGYQVARAALQPVDGMRRRAAEISDRNPSERLPLPEADDEIHALGSTLNDMLDRLEEGVARERRLVSDASHELRTPLTTLRAELALALKPDRDAAALREAIASADHEAHRISRIADDLLVLARADRGRLPLNQRRQPAGDLLAAAAGRARAVAAEERRTVAVAPGGDADAVVDADPDRLAQALDNLVGNSLKHGRGEIELQVERDGERVELHVLDRGPGFADEFVDRPFDRFSRDAASDTPGAGLGLAIVAAIAGLHGGGVGARNRPDGGADVWLWLPDVEPATTVSFTPWPPMI